MRHSVHCSTSRHEYEFELRSSLGGPLWIDRELSSFKVRREGNAFVVLDHPTTTVIASGLDARELAQEMDAYLDWQRLTAPTVTLEEEFEDEFFFDATGDDEIL